MCRKKDKTGWFFRGLVPLNVAMTTALYTSSGWRLSWPTGRGEQVMVARGVLLEVPTGRKSREALPLWAPSRRRCISSS